MSIESKIKLEESYRKLMLSMETIVRELEEAVETKQRK